MYIHKHTRLCLPIYRLGAIHRALAMFPGLAATGGRPAPSSSPEDRSSSQAEAGCQHHLCLTGYIVWVKHTHRPPCFSLTVCFHIYEWYVNSYTLLRACRPDTQSSTAPPRLRGWQITARKTSSRHSPPPLCLGWDRQWTPPPLDRVSNRRLLNLYPRPALKKKRQTALQHCVLHTCLHYSMINLILNF